MGIGFTRKQNVAAIQVTTTPRALADRKHFYALMVERLGALGIGPDGVMINLVSAPSPTGPLAGVRPIF